MKNTTLFKIRFNTTHGDTDLFWRLIINETEHLVRSIVCDVPTYTESSFDNGAGCIKYHIAGVCTTFEIDNTLNAVIR